MASPCLRRRAARRLIDTPYKHKRTFALLTLLYDWVDTRNDFHVDHVFPRSLATAAKLRRQGVPDADLDEFATRSSGSRTCSSSRGRRTSRSGPSFLRTGSVAVLSEDARNAWLAGHDLHGMPTDLVDFLPFYEERRAIMRERLVQLLGAAMPPSSRAGGDGSRR